MKHTIISLALLSASVSAQAQLLPAQSGDLVPARLSSTAVKALQPQPAETLHYAWRLEADSNPGAAQSPYRAESREFWADHDADAMARGIVIRTTAPGALIRISPIGAASRALQPAELSIERDGRVYANGSGLTSVARPQDLAEGTAPFPQGSSAFRLDAALGAGEFVLRAPTANGRHLVHVFEPDSSDVLSLQASADAHLSGTELRVRAQFERAGRSHAVDRIGGLLNAPDGRSFELEFRRTADGSYEASLPAPSPAAMGGPVLWEVHSFGSADGVLRDAKTAIAITAPVARLDGSASAVPVRAPGTHVVVRFGVDAAAAGRYQLTGTLWGSTARGEMVPVALAQNASTLGAGKGELELRFGNDLIDPAGVQAPFEIRDLRLHNQADMGLLERRAQAWRSAPGIGK